MRFKKLKQNAIVPIGAFIFIIFALYNSYPIINSDTTSYLNSGFNMQVPDDRPIFYGIFLRISSLGVSLWLSAYVQSLMLSYLLIQFTKRILPEIDSIKTLALLLFISLGTISSWCAGQILPDIFTSIVFLATINFILIKNSCKKSILFLAIALAATLMHFSHYMISLLFALVVFVGSFVHVRLRSYRVKSIVLMAGSIFCWLSLFTSNYMGGKGFVASNASHVFLMGKLTESGVLKTYLDKACPIRSYKICNYKNELPPVAWEFVWDQQNSPVFKEGGWAATKQEYNVILHDIASRPKYWPYLAFKSTEATARQIVLTNIDESEELPWAKFDKEHPAYQFIEQKFPHEINEFKFSKQNLKILNIKFYDDVYVIILVLSTIVLMFLLKGNIKREAALIYFFLILFLVLNAFVTASFGNVLSRLNSRAIWLLPAVNIIFIAKTLMTKSSLLKQHNELEVR